MLTFKDLYQPFGTRSQVVEFQLIVHRIIQTYIVGRESFGVQLGHGGHSATIQLIVPGILMAKKTVIRRLFKYLPVSIEALEITNADAKREAGEKVEPDDVINIEAVSVEDFEDCEVISTQESAHEPQD